MPISFPQNTRDIINEIRLAIGRDITFQSIVTAECTYSGCNIDPITNTSTNSFCPICSGVGYTTTVDETDIEAHITWKPTEATTWITAGKFYTGDCVVQLEYTDVNFDTVNECKYVVVDDKRLRIKNRIYRGVPELNRIILDCELEEE